MYNQNSVVKIIKDSELPETFFTLSKDRLNVSLVAEIVSSIQKNGDRAISSYTKEFDHLKLTSFEIDLSLLKEAESDLKKKNTDLYAALVHSRELALSFALRQKENYIDFETQLLPGLYTGQKIIPVQRAGLYIPSGRYPLLSSVIMCSVPAFAAGVEEIIMCSPPQPNPAKNMHNSPWVNQKIMAVASLCGVKRVFAVGGAQAIAAMAYGTETIPSANVIVGPGNKYVAAAKKLVYGDVGIDMLAGPTEVMIIADATANPEWVAADLIAQAEHDPDAQAVLIVKDEGFAKKVEEEIRKNISALSPKDNVVFSKNNSVALQSLATNGLIIIASSWDSAINIANKKGPEHLELAMEKSKERDYIEEKVRNYGSLFIGHYAAEVLGDYTAGLNHTLPTSGSALYTGGLSVRHFLKTVTTLRTDDGLNNDSKNINQLDQQGLVQSLKAAEIIAKAEGLEGHALAARCRLK